MGSPQFSVPPLLSLLRSDYDLVAVYTREPKPAGRGQKITKTPVHIIAEEYNVPVYNPKSLRNEEQRKIFFDLKPDVAVVAAYGLILPESILLIPKYGCINIHPSLLPRWRGASPIQYAILSGEKETGVTIMKMDQGLDTGAMLLQKKIFLNNSDNYQIMHDKLSVLGSEMILTVLKKICDSDSSLVAIKQDEGEALYASKITNFQIDWSDSAKQINRKIRALYPRAFFFLSGKRVRILEADYLENSEKLADIGKIINNKMHIKCGHNSILVPKIIQLEGKTPMNVEKGLNGVLCEGISVL